MPVRRDRAPLADRPANGGMALLVVDMISNWEQPGAGALLPVARRIATRIARLKQRCAERDVPVVFVNDNRGKWRSDFPALVAAALASDAGSAIAAALDPSPADYAVLKAKHSGFMATLLDLLLRHLAVTRLVLTGVEAERCILLTAADALMRDYEVVVPSDCVGSQRAEHQRMAIAYLQRVWKVPMTPSPRIALPARRARR